MKIRSDFVSNSSSTSFVIITANGFERGDFLELMGVKERSPLVPLFEALFYSLQENMYHPSDYFNRYGKALSDWTELLRNDFEDEVVERIIGAENSGHKVFVGKLSSDNNPIESFFCVDSFEVENAKIYFNALDCSW